MENKKYPEDAQDILEVEIPDPDAQDVPVSSEVTMDDTLVFSPEEPMDATQVFDPTVIAEAARKFEQVIPEEMPAPAEEVPALIMEAPDLIEEEPGPVMDGPILAEEGPAPIYETPGLVEEEPAPIMETADIVVASPGPTPQEEFLFFEEEKAPDEAYREPEDRPGDLNTMWQAPPEEYRDAPAPVRAPRPPRKGRPKRKKGYGFFGIPHLIATAIWLMIIVAVGVSLGRMLWVCAADVLAFGRQDKVVSITIDTDDTIDDIAEKLHRNGLVRYPGLFKLYAQIAVDEGEIASGTFSLNTMYDYHAIVNGMSAYSAFRSVVEDVVIPEGYNCRQIFALLEERGICSVAELEAYAANGEFKDFWFLEGLERGDKYCLEGFLFPDTYDFYEGSTPREALGKMLLGFEARFTEEMRSQLPALNERLAAMMRRNGCSQEFIDNNQIGIYELVIVASLIEEEAASANESKDIASVIYNRLTQDQSYERYLGIDATILYALGEHKDTLSKDDLNIDSPYNTRTHAGLVPTPISNPGLSSLEAALDFADTEFYYYVLNPETGRHQFSKTLAEHEQWIARFSEVG